MQFEIDPFSTTVQAPVKECEFGKLYKPVDASAILYIFGASGNWDLIVSSGSSPFAVLNISIVLKTTHLAFQLGGTAVALTRRISDSSVAVDAPGLQTGGGVSAAGYGSRHELIIYSIGQPPNRSAWLYSYPYPVIANLPLNTSPLSRAAPSGSESVNNAGRFFANIPQHSFGARIGGYCVFAPEHAVEQ